MEGEGKRHLEWKKERGGGSWVFLGASEERKMRHMNGARFIWSIKKESGRPESPRFSDFSFFLYPSLFTSLDKIGDVMLPPPHPLALLAGG